MGARGEPSVDAVSDSSSSDEDEIPVSRRGSAGDTPAGVMVQPPTAPVFKGQGQLVSQRRGSQLDVRRPGDLEKGADFYFSDAEYTCDDDEDMCWSMVQNRDQPTLEGEMALQQKGREKGAFYFSDASRNDVKKGSQAYRFRGIKLLLKF